MILQSLLRAHARQAPNRVAQGRFYYTHDRFKPSFEQLEVLNSLQTHNVAVSARPGAGKTATAVALAQENPNVPIAVITYSKHLQLDTERRLKKYVGVQAFTFHGLAGHLFGRIIKDDIDLLGQRASEPVLLIDDFLKYRFIVLDEFQDLTDNLYWLVSTFIASIARGSGRSPGILVLGDSRQAIYDYQGADSRFLEQAEMILRPVSDRDWKSLSLAQSFRLTRPTADFINNACLDGEQYIVGTDDGPKPLYLRANLWQSEAIFNFLWPHIQKYGPDKCAILAPSIRSKAPRHYLTLLSNTLSRRGVPVSVSIYDDAPLDDAVTQGKLVVSTYHQFKGSERDLVVVFGADESWFKWFGRDVPRHCCPNAVFVALTRARKQVSELSDPTICVADILYS
jgi:superfamily I DNA/RNA helicase